MNHTIVINSIYKKLIFFSIETSDESDEDGPTISHGSPTIVQPQGKQEDPRGIEIQKQGILMRFRFSSCSHYFNLLPWKIAENLK